MTPGPASDPRRVLTLADLVRPGGTRILCNPAGPRFGNAEFRDDLVVEVWRRRDRQQGRRWWDGGVHRTVPGVMHGSLYVSRPRRWSAR